MDSRRLPSLVDVAVGLSLSGTTLPILDTGSVLGLLSCKATVSYQLVRLMPQCPPYGILPALGYPRFPLQFCGVVQRCGLVPRGLLAPIRVQLRRTGGPLDIVAVPSMLVPRDSVLSSQEYVMLLVKNYYRTVCMTQCSVPLSQAGCRATHWRASRSASSYLPMFWYAAARLLNKV